MGNQEQNKKIRDFLNRSNTASLDDFEKEALEGFESLDSAEELYELKADLDQKIKMQVFAKKEKPFGLVWYAAAGLILLVGLSAYFFMSTADFNRREKAALIDAKGPNELPSELRMAEPSASQEANLPAISLSEKTGTPLAKIEKPRKQTEQAAEEMLIIDDPGKLQPNFSESSDQNLASTAPIEESMGKNELPASITRENETAKLNRKAIAEDAGSSKQKNSSKKNKASSKSTDAERTTAARDEMASSDALHKEEQAEVDALISKQEQSKQAATFSPKNAPTQSPSIAEPGDARPEINFNNIKNQNCFYIGGAVALNKDLGEKLKSLKNIGAFEAVLHINSNQQVEKVQITDPAGMDKKEQKIVEAALKTLDKFGFKNKPEKGQLHQFEVKYQP
jgi:hypothetical protein